MKPIVINSFLKSTLHVAIAVAFIGAFSSIARADDHGDAEHGEKVFKKCQACHTIEKDGPDRVGPNLHDVMERGIAAKPDYNYSKAMKAFAATGAKWTEETLFKYLEKPRALVPGTYMSFAGLKKAQDRRDLLAYLEKAEK
jgi:cytochrome c